MHFSAFALAAVFGFPVPISALATRQPQDTAPRTLHLTSQRTLVSDPVRRDQLRRRGTVHADLTNKDILYFVNFTLGTPPQALRASLDTGSSDLWVNVPTSALCNKKGNPCGRSGTFSIDGSSTLANLTNPFEITYSDGTSASGDYATDTLTLSGTTLEKFQFGIGYNSTSAEAVFGIGYPQLEAQAMTQGGTTYENLPAKLVSSGAIASSAYSLWLNDLDASTGSVLFGGIDTEKYVGGLATLPIQPNSGVYNQIKITLTGVSFNGTKLATDIAHAVSLDAGSSLTYLPDPIVTKLYSMIGAQYDSSMNAAYLPCSMAYSGLNVTFQFTSPTISVGMDELVLDVSSSGDNPQFTDGSDACICGILPAGAGPVVLGDTFLRSAYVVVDLASNQVSLGQTKFNTTRSNIVEIASTGQVPNATNVPNPVSATLGVSIGKPTSSSSSPSSTSSPNAGSALTPSLGLGLLTFGGIVLSLV